MWIKQMKENIDFRYIWDTEVVLEATKLKVICIYKYIS